MKQLLYEKRKTKGEIKGKKEIFDNRKLDRQIEDKL